MKQAILIEIESKRAKLVLLAIEKGSFTDKDVILLSEQLDILLLKLQKLADVQRQRKHIYIGSRTVFLHRSYAVPKWNHHSKLLLAPFLT